MLSTRFAVPVAALLALAAVPTVIHSYFDTSVHDGRTARAIPAALAGEEGTDAKRRANWGHDRFASDDWIDRRYSGPPEVKLVVARSFDAKKLYHHPELAADYGEGYEAAEAIRLPGRSDIPVYLLRGGRANRERMALYALQYADGYVEDPIRFQLRTSFRSLFSRRMAMTLFFAAQHLPAGTEVHSSRAATLLVNAIEAFEKGRQ
jgi:hypothetical protein